ncbi:hypothetical protein GOODEAATRI_013822, partial [Goodea atripinnis]
VEQSKKPLGPLLWYSMVEDLINEEEKVALQIKVSLMEVTSAGRGYLNQISRYDSDVLLSSFLLVQILFVIQGLKTALLYTAELCRKQAIRETTSGEHFEGSCFNLTVLHVNTSFMCEQMENILDSREQEENNLKVFSSELEQVMACREKWEEERTSKEDLFMIHEQEMNVLVPFLSQLESSDALNSEEVRSLCVDCLARFKERLEEHTSFLQKNLETVIENQEADEDHQHDPTMSMQEAELTCHLCWDKNFYISAAQRRLDK